MSSTTRSRPGPHCRQVSPGHLVLSTMHTIDARETIGRMIELFPSDKQPLVRQILAADAPGRRQPATSATRRRWPGRRRRGDDQHRSHLRSHPRRREDRGHTQGARRGRVPRHAELPPAPDQACPGGGRRCRYRRGRGQGTRTISRLRWLMLSVGVQRRTRATSSPRVIGRSFPATTRSRRKTSPRAAVFASPAPDA